MGYDILVRAGRKQRLFKVNLPLNSALQRTDRLFRQNKSISNAELIPRKLLRRR